jgi:uncharacterized repeat protein (TIGR01451 family)/CSLREA domain-containing protein
VAEQFRWASLVLLAGVVAGPAAAAPFVVNSVGDEDAQGATNNGVCNSTAGTCTLRAAIREANGTSGADVITFNIAGAGVHSIVLTSALPTIAETVTIDGTTQPGFTGAPLIEVNGSSVTDVLVLSGTASSNSTIKGLAINRCTGIAIRISSGSLNNVIAGNYLGTDATGTLALGNGRGVAVQTSGNRIGGTAAGEGNLISGNSVNGIAISSSAATGNLVLGNRIGTNAAATGAVGNAAGIVISGGASGNTIGGTTVAARNVISGNTVDGIQVTGAGTNNNAVQGNYIGVDVTGTVDLGNTNQGVAIFTNPQATTIGGTAPGAGNVISGNNGIGIGISDAATGTIVQGNRIGTNAAGTAALGNTLDGVKLDVGAANTAVGGTVTGAGNIVSGNAGAGVKIVGVGTTNNVVAGNLIGTNATGTAAIGNARNGVEINSAAAGNTVGGTAAAARNVISGNSGVGVLIDSANTNNNVITGNFIGTDAAGSAALGNAAGGVLIFSNGPSGNRIGGTAAGAGNLIAFNGDYGVACGSGTANTILGNAIHSNATLGIDLLANGVTPNDALDGDAGPNNLLNFPVITSTSVAAGTITVNFQLDVPAGSYRIEFFKNPSGVDPTSFGEGQVFASFKVVTHPGGGVVAFAHSFPGSTGDVISATTTFCTDGAPCTTFGDTSEFSSVMPPPADMSITKAANPATLAQGATLTYTLTITNNGPNASSGSLVTDTLPPGVTFVSVTPTAPTICSQAGGVVTCNVGGLAQANSTTITIVVVPNTAGSIVNTATVKGNEADTSTANDTASVTTTVVVPTDAVAFFTVTSTPGQNFVEWLNPAIADYIRTHIVYKKVDGSSACTFPTNASDGTVLTVQPGLGAGKHDSVAHTGLANNNTTYCYAAFVERTGPPTFSTGRFTKGRPFGLPFDTIPGVKWAFSTGATSMAPPGIGPATYAVSNDRVLHGMVRGTGATAGEWPSGWTPWAMNFPAQSRPPVVNTTSIPGATRVVFLGSQDGKVYAINALTGAKLWESAVLGSAVQAAPSGIFADFGGAFDYILVGTRNASGGNLFYALKVSDGSTVGAPFNGGSPTAIGIISSAAAVDYANKRVYFASRAGSSSNTLWCLDITAAGVSFAWALPLGDIDGGPVVRSGRVYVGNNTGTVWGVDAFNGANAWSYGTGDGAVKGFVFTDRFSSRLYLSTLNNVWGLADNASVPLWPAVPLTAPSIPLFVNASPYIYVGSSDGRLYQLDTSLANSSTAPVVKSVPLGDALAGVGAPSFDVPNALIYVGGEAGVIYGVQYPFP